MSPEDRRAQPPPAIVEPPEGSIADVIRRAVPGVEMQAIQSFIDVLLVIDRKDVRAVLEPARNHPDLAFDFLRNLSGVDFEADGFEVVYHLFSYKHRHNVTIRAKVPRDDTTIATVSDLWEAADWHERECRDMFGIVFDGHPNLVPLLLPDDMLDHFPLRKDNPLAPLEEWQGEALGSNMASAGHIPAGSGFEVEASAEGE
jgi:NADH-quinone oxidoreductase subunit C